MDQELKQRLVGAVVITALAAIFVPMLFDDPVDETGKKINEIQIPALPSRFQSANSSGLPKSTEEVINLPVRKPLKTIDSGSEGADKRTGWILQAGVFSQQDNAMVLQEKLRKQGFAASVAKVNGDKGKMYRVKVGPELSRAKAEQVKAKLEQLNNINSFISKDED